MSNYLRGTNVPNPKQLAKLAEALGTTPGDILNADAEALGASRALSLTHVDQRDGHLRLQIDQVVPADVATQVIGLLLPRISSNDEAALPKERADDEEIEMPRVRTGGRSILDTLLPANPPTPINAKQIRPLDGPAPDEEFQKVRKVG